MADRNAWDTRRNTGRWPIKPNTLQDFLRHRILAMPWGGMTETARRLGWTLQRLQAALLNGNASVGDVVMVMSALGCEVAEGPLRIRLMLADDADLQPDNQRDIQPPADSKPTARQRTKKRSIRK